MTEDDSKPKTTAIVEVRLRVELPDTWSPETDLQQVYSQALASARNRVSQMIADQHAMTLLGDSEVQVVLVPVGRQ